MVGRSHDWISALNRVTRLGTCRCSSLSARLASMGLLLFALVPRQMVSKSQIHNEVLLLSETSAYEGIFGGSTVIDEAIMSATYSALCEGRSSKIILEMG